MTADSALLGLLELARRARKAASMRELEFMAVNDSHGLAPFRQAALWYASTGVACLSGVVQVEANAPYVQWLSGVCEHLARQEGASPRAVGASELPDALRDQWQEWLPAHAVWITGSSKGSGAEDGTSFALLLARDFPWGEREMQLLSEWIDIWGHARRCLEPSRTTWLPRLLGQNHSAPWWRRRAPLAAIVTTAVLLLPVRLTVLAPGELVPARPAVVRAPLDGVIDVMHVDPNQEVRKGQPLFDFDEALIRSRLEIARQGQTTAEAEYRQTVQQALSNEDSKTQLAVLRGKIDEKRSEASFLEGQLSRARVLAPRDGLVLSDDPSEWVGRPVTVGERVMRIASPDETEVEAWIPVSDAIPLEAGAPVSLYLNASPLEPVRAMVRYIAHDAVQRPDGTYAYRMRAGLSAPTGHRVGSKGTAKLQGNWVLFSYWMLRRPLASLRATAGW